MQGELDICVGQFGSKVVTRALAEDATTVEVHLGGEIESSFVSFEAGAEYIEKANQTGPKRGRWSNFIQFTVIILFTKRVQTLRKLLLSQAQDQMLRTKVLPEGFRLQKELLMNKISEP